MLNDYSKMQSLWEGNWKGGTLLQKKEYTPCNTLEKQSNDSYSQFYLLFCVLYRRDNLCFDYHNIAQKSFTFVPVRIKGIHREK